MSTLEERVGFVEKQSLRAEKQAIRAEQASNATTNGLMTLEREIKALRADLAVGLANLKSQIGDLKKHHQRTLTLEELDYQETPTGSIKVDKETFRRWQTEEMIASDAKKYRALWKRLRWLFFLLVGGGATFAGERLFEFLTKHL